MTTSKQKTRKDKHEHTQTHKNKYTRIHLGDLWQYNIPQTTSLHLSHAHTHFLWLLADLSLLSVSPAAAGQREGEKHTNKWQIYDQPDFCLRVRLRAGSGGGTGKKTQSEASFVPKPSTIAPSSGQKQIWYIQKPLRRLNDWQTNWYSHWQWLSSVKRQCIFFCVWGQAESFPSVAHALVLLISPFHTAWFGRRPSRLFMSKTCVTALSGGRYPDRPLRLLASTSEVCQKRTESLVIKPLQGRPCLSVRRSGGRWFDPSQHVKVPSNPQTDPSALKVNH